MLAGIIVFIGVAAAGAAVYVKYAIEGAERQKYYDAAYKVVKEECLNYAIRNQRQKMQGGYKIMLYLKWKNHGKQGYVFNPENSVRIGRSPEENDICIRDETVSLQHCILFLYQGQLYLQDCNSRNGTWLKQGMRKKAVQGIIPVFSGDQIIVAGMKMKVTIFTFDMAYV